MQPERRIPWLLVAAPFLLQQFVAIAVLGLVLQPPAANDGGFYSIRFGVVVLGSYAALVGATVVIANRYGDPRPRLALRRTPVGRTAGIVVATFGVAVVASLALEPIFHGVTAQDVDPGPFPGGAAATAGLGARGPRRRRGRADRRGALLPRPPAGRAGRVRASPSRSSARPPCSRASTSCPPRYPCCSSTACSSA